MRVIAGQAKGHTIKVPKGTPTRPATDLVRGAIFSMLGSLGCDMERVLDLFSGSGALGIEALSRGAGAADFVDRESRCCAVIKDNLRKTGLIEKAQVFCVEVKRALTFLDKEYGLVLMDPPYADTTIGNVITQISASTLIGSDSIVIVTHSPRLTLAKEYDRLNMFNERRHGDSVIALFRKGE